MLEGWAGRVGFGAAGPTYYPVTHWTVTTKVETADITRAEDFSASYPIANTTVRTYVPVACDIDATIEMLWDKTLNPLHSSTTPSLRPAQKVFAYLSLDKANATCLFSLYLLLTDMTIDQEVRGVCKVTLIGKQIGQAGGVFVFPVN